jgi:hypothetical protein
MPCLKFLPILEWRFQMTVVAALVKKHKSSATTISYVVAAAPWNIKVEISAVRVNAKMA